MKQYKLYIFDFDNTLFDTSAGMEICYINALKKIGISYKKELLNEFIRESLQDTYLRYKNNLKNFHEFEKEFLDSSKKFMCEKTVSFFDTEKTINTLKNLNINLAIVTGKPKERVYEILSKYNLISSFDYIIGYNDYKKSKPDPESLLSCIDKYNYSLNDIVYVGDSISDMIAAKNAGINAIYINRENTFVSEYETIYSLSELISNCKLCLNTICNIPYDLFANNEQKLKEFISFYINCSTQNIIVSCLDRNLITLIIDNNLYINIYRYGIIVINKKYSYSLKMDYKEIIEFKDNVSDIVLGKECESKKGIEVFNVSLFIKEFTECIKVYFSKKELRKIKSKLYDNNHISYNLATYDVFSITQDKEFINNVMGIILKKKYTCNLNSLQKEMQKNDIVYYEFDSESLFAAIWGARILINHNSQSEWINEYLKYESQTQSVWYLLYTMNKLLDSEAKKGYSNNKLALIDTTYDVLLAIADFKYISQNKTHRYQIDMLQILFTISGLEKMTNYLTEKVEIYSQKMDIVNDEKANKNANILNSVLFLLTMISSISAIFQIVNLVMKSKFFEVKISLFLSAAVLICIIVIWILMKIITPKKC